MALQRNLFGASSATQRPARGQSRTRTTTTESILTPHERTESGAPRPRSSPSSFYYVHGRSYTREELLARADFDRWCRDMPGERLAVLLVVSPTTANVCVIVIDPPEGDMPPWWRHGDIVVLNIQPPAGNSPAAASICQENP